MKSFLNYSKNRLIYSLFRLLIFIAIGFIIGSINVKADIVEHKFFGVSSTSSSVKVSFFDYLEENTYPDDYIVIDNTEERFFSYSYCATGFIDFAISKNYSGETLLIGYSTGGSCFVQGSTGKTYSVYLLARSVSDVRNDGNYMIMFDLFAKNYNNYTVLLTELGLSSVDSIPAGVLVPNYEGEFFALNEKLETVDDAVKTLNEVQQKTNEELQKNTEEQQKTNEKLDEAQETRKGIWQTIKELPSKFLDMLKSLFIPEDGYFQDWFDDLKTFFELKLGFLATPFTIFIDFVNLYLNLDSSNDIIINIPDITVPNFEDYKIISATSFNWSELLKSKESLSTLWELYLSFVDVFLIINFLNLCENKYNHIFGGDTSNYDYYTVEDSYTYDNDTGEVLSVRRNERRTSKRRVDE